MTPVERARALCKEKGIRISQMEKDVGFANGYFNPKKSGMIASDRIVALAEYLDTTVEYLLSGEEKRPAEAGQRDELIRLFDAAPPALQAAALAVLKSAEAAPKAQDADPAAE